MNNSTLLFSFLFAFLLGTALTIPSSSADEFRALPANQLPDDKRLQDPITLHDYHPFRQVKNKETWETKRRQEIRDRVLLASGLLPLPEKTPLNERRFGKVDRKGFTVEKVYFESFPGHFVTASLYSPAGDSAKIGLKNGKRPAVLCPHGHWKNGRFYDVLSTGEAAVNMLIAKGEERFFNAARNPIQARCVQLARMGCYVLQYDMLGNADSIQFAEHRRGPRPEMNSAEAGKWGFVSPQAVLRLQTNFGLQTWNSIRAVDFLSSFDDVDQERIMVTGASGGGTQTMMIAAVDERISAAFPCVMPSTAMQGGCTCENACFLRIGQGNMDIAAALAPKPLGMTAADDWTIELKTKGHPDLVELYKMLKAPKNYEAHFNVHFKHNYNHVSRTLMYDFANRHLGLGLPKPVLESDHEFLGPDEISVWKNPEDKPDHWKDGPQHERELNGHWASDSANKVSKALADLKSGNSSLFEEAIAKGWRLILRRSYDQVGDVQFTLAEKEKTANFTVMSGLIDYETEKEQVPALFYYPANWNGEVAIWLSNKGKAGLYNGTATSPMDPVRKMVGEGIAVMGLDLFMQGEFLTDGETKVQNSEVTYSRKNDVPADSWQRSPVYYYGYNDSVFVRRVP